MDAKYLITRDGRTFCRFEGLLLAAHDAGLSDISTTMLQAPAESNGWTAIVQARVALAKGSYSGIGDASPASVARHLAPHVVRMAETRGLARALRFGLGVAATAVEELGPIVADHDDADSPKATPPAKATTTPRATMAPARLPASSRT